MAVAEHQCEHFCPVARYQNCALLHSDGISPAGEEATADAIIHCLLDSRVRRRAEPQEQHEESTGAMVRTAVRAPVAFRSLARDHLSHRRRTRNRLLCSHDLRTLLRLVA